MWKRDKKNGQQTYRCSVKLYAIQRKYMGGKGYVTRRGRHLAAQRQRIVNQLEVLHGTQ